MTRAVRDKINFPEYSDLIEFLIGKRIFRIMWHTAYSSSDGFSNPETIVYKRTTVRYGGIKIIIKRFDSKLSYSPHEEKHLFSAEWWCSKTETRQTIETSNENELIEFVRKFY